jgi:uracil-DNA glycosylase
MSQMDWNKIIKEECKKEYFKVLLDFIVKEYEYKSILPPKELIFKALDLTPFNETKVIILGQDPYPNKENACGLSFSSCKDSNIPSSLRNIFIELKDDLGIINNSGDLENWCKQGVLLLNSILTVEEGKTNSHKGIGWEIFTDRLIYELSINKNNLVFILWGSKAQNKVYNINLSNHLVIKSVHPSPNSCYRGFFGSKPFSKTNNYLINNLLKPIDWKL